MRAQSADTAVVQITTSALGESFPGGISGNARFVVIESTGDIATEKTPNVRNTAGALISKGRNNEDGNREIFLFDYAQRRIFQLTVTESALITPTTPTPTPTPAATPTPVPSPTPVPGNRVEIEVSNNRPAISYDGKWIAFNSNAPNPASLDANEAANRLALGTTDANQEIFIYRIPDTTDVDLSSGLDVPKVNLDAGTFTRLTNTLASRPPQPGSLNSAGQILAPFIAFDNRSVAMNDDASFVAFISTRQLAVSNGLANGDENPEVYVYNRTGNSFSQLTDTQGNQIFNENPALSGDGASIAFVSNANPQDSAGAADNADGSAEVYLAGFNGLTRTTLRQVTRTTTSPGLTVNIFSPGRRLSRNGAFIAFESYADLAGSAALQSAPGLYLYNVGANSFALVGPRAAATDASVLRYPTFSGDSNLLVFATSLNFNADGTAPATATDGLNPGRNAQVFTTPVAAPTTFTRLTTTPGVAGTVLLPSEIQPLVGNTAQRLAFGTRGEIGGGNIDRLPEDYYLFRPDVASETPASANAISYATGASGREVVAPAATPTPPAVTGLAAGMLGVARSSAVPLAPSARAAGAAPEMRRPQLPTELNGVSLTVGGIAAGLYQVSSNEISFVVPSGLAATGANAYAVTLNNNTAVVRSALQLAAFQPDIFASVIGGGGRAAVLNVTNPLSDGTVEPFTITTTYLGSDNLAKTDPTVLRILVTGAATATRTQITVRIKDTDLTGDAIVFAGPTLTPGIEQIDVRLPATLAAAGDAPIVVTITGGAASRPAESAPRIQIN
ncbi:MAG: hypothetical protein WKF30_02040 [Pyrinomonadaceae bacterium]